MAYSHVGSNNVDQGGGIDEIRLYQNKKLINNKKRGFKLDTNVEKVVNEEYEVMLVPGINELWATAFNDDRTEAVPARIAVELTAPTATADLYLLAIGINEYKNANYYLNYRKPDAVEFSTHLQQQGKNILRKSLSNKSMIRKLFA